MSGSFANWVFELLWMILSLYIDTWSNRSLHHHSPIDCEEILPLFQNQNCRWKGLWIFLSIWIFRYFFDQNSMRDYDIASLEFSKNKWNYYYKIIPIQINVIIISKSKLNNKLMISTNLSLAYNSIWKDGSVLKFHSYLKFGKMANLIEKLSKDSSSLLIIRIVILKL